MPHRSISTKGVATTGTHHTGFCRSHSPINRIIVLDIPPDTADFELPVALKTVDSIGTLYDSFHADLGALIDSRCMPKPLIQNRTGHVCGYPVQTTEIQCRVGWTPLTTLAHGPNRTVPFDLP